MGQILCVTGHLCPASCELQSRGQGSLVLADQHGRPLFVLRSNTVNLGRLWKKLRGRPVRVCGLRRGGLLGAPPVLEVLEAEPVDVLRAGPFAEPVFASPAMVSTELASVNVAGDLASHCWHRC